MLLHPVEFADGLVTVGTGVDDVLTPVNAEWNQTATKPQAKKDQHSTDYPGQGTRLVRCGGGDVGMAVRTLHGHRGLPKTMRKNRHSSSDNGCVVLRRILWGRLTVPWGWGFDLVEAVEGLMKAAVREPLNKDQVRVIDDQSSTLLCLYFYLFQRNVTLILWFDVGSLKGLKLIVNLIGYVRVLLISF